MTQPNLTKLVLLPGTQCNHKLWYKLFSKLSASLDPHHIAIEKLTSRTAITEMIADSIGNGGHLVGFSMGGYLALDFALRYPRKVTSLVIIASSSKGLSKEEQTARTGILNYLQNHTYTGMSQTRIREFIYKTAWNEPSIVNTIKQMDRELGKDTLINQLKETSARPDLSGSLKRLKLKTLIVGGCQDGKIDAKHLQDMAATLPNGRCELIERCGHMVPLEHPERLSELMNEFYLGFESNE